MKKPPSERTQRMRAKQGCCPNCNRNDNLNFGSMEHTGCGTIQQEGDCMDCGAQWWEVYTFSNVCELEVHPENIVAEEQSA